jgi:hypothetical protein
MLTEEQRNSWIKPADRWENNEGPFVTDDALSEYCSTKLQIGMKGVEGTIHTLWVPLHFQCHLEVD